MNDANLETRKNQPEEWIEQMSVLLEPQFYPDQIFFRDSLVQQKKYNEEFKSNFQTNKSTLNVLAPYIETIYKDQKKALVESAKSINFTTKTKEAKLLLFDQASSVPVDIREQYELIVSIHETADILKTLIKADNVISYLVNPNKNEIYQSPRFVVSSMSTLTSKIEAGSTLAAYTAFTKRYVLTNNVLTDPRFPLGLGFGSSLAKYALCVPIKTMDEKVVAMYELTRDAFGVEFEQSDIQLILTVVGWMGFTIQYNNLCTGLMHRLDLSDYLLQLTGHYHGGHTTLHETLYDIVTFAKQTLSAERSNLFLVEKVTEDTMMIEEYNQDTENSLFKKKKKKIIGNDGSYISQVLFAKETVNKYETQVEITHSLSSIKLRSIICVPILCKCDEVIGIIQLTNKKTAVQFDKDDEEILHMFAVFFSINLNRNKLQEEEKKSLVQNNINREMLLHQMEPCVHDKEMFKEQIEIPDDFYMIDWFPSSDHRTMLPKLAMQLFQEVLGNPFMKFNDVGRFILTVQKCYRLNSYHNFTHAFNATHKMATILKSYNAMFTRVERKGLMIAILCHDVDHHGYSNSFIKLTEHYLSKLYDSSQMENHHFAVTKIIIEKCEMLKHLKADIYNKVITEIYECIVATDLSYYFQSRMKLLKLAESKSLDLKENDHRRLIKNLMMVACDLSYQTSFFPDCRKITKDRYEEFFCQGDIFKKKGLSPMPYMDRLQKDMIPENQIQFLTVVILPCLQTLAQLFEVMGPLVSNCKEVIKQWQMLVEAKDQDTWKPDESIPKY